MIPLKQRGQIRRTYIYIYQEGRSDGHIYICYKIEQHDSTKTKGKDQTDKYIYTIRLNNRPPLKQRGNIRRTHIYTIRLNNRPPLKQSRKISRTHIYTKEEDQTGTYIYTIRLNNMTPLKQRGKIRRTYIYILRGKIRRTHIYML